MNTQITLKLFKAVPIGNFRIKPSMDSIVKICSLTIPKGFVFSKEVFETYTEAQLIYALPTISKEVGLNAEQMNVSFHKSWGKVANASMIQLVIEQILHYWTTYGYEYYGIYDKNTVYVPKEKLSIPELTEDIKLTIIKAYTDQEFKEKSLILLNQGIALKEDTMKELVEIILTVGVTETEIDNIRNKETKCMMYDLTGKVPINAVEFLRYLVYKSTGKTLLIKNKATIKTIKQKQEFDSAETTKIFYLYKNKYGYEKLAEIFLRFKPLFLAFKANSDLKTDINKISKLSSIYHTPMKTDYLNNVTAILTRGNIDRTVLQKELEKVNTFRKIRLAYALNFRTKDATAIMYRIRNGKTYTSKFGFNDKVRAQLVLTDVLSSIIKSINKNVAGKTIYLPNNVTYALPSTEKQFIGNLPCGTTVDVPTNMIFGIHWENAKKTKRVENSYYYDDDNGRVDLDLKTMNLLGTYGWDGSYRSSDRGLLFSGDITDAPLPLGASEYFYVRPQDNDAYIVTLNTYTGQKNIPYKIIIASEPVTNLYHNYVVNPNNVIAIINSETSGDTRQKTLGIVTTSPKGNKFIFAEGDMINKITSRYDKYADQSKRFLVDYYSNMISLNEILRYSEAKIVDDPSKADIDLSLENLEKDTILNLLK